MKNLPSKLEKPSQIVKRRIAELNKLEIEAIDAISNTLNINREQAQELLYSTDERWEKLKNVARRMGEVKLMEIMPKIMQAAQDKIDKGSLEQMKHAIVAYGVARRETFGEPGKGQPSLMIGGKQVQINLGFKFSPYSIKTKKIK